MHKKVVVLLVFLLTSCASIMLMPVEAAWSGQPEGARAAFIRCMYEVSESQCGTSNVRNPAVEQCMKLQVGEYKDSDAKERWLFQKGCDRKRAKLRKGEI